MGARRGSRRGRRAGAGLAAAAVAGTGMFAMAPASGAVEVGAECRVVELPAPAGGYDAGVMDIEVVDGETVYYGSYLIRDEEGREHQRAVIWRGLDGTPEPLDLGLGREHDIAFELTETGLVNGQSEDGEREVTPWVMDLHSGSVTVVDTATGSGTDGSAMSVRRINDTGAVVGSDSPGRGAAAHLRAFAWDHFTAAPERLDARAFQSWGWGINNLGDRSGMVAKDKRPGYPQWTDFTPMVWGADGTARELPRVGIDAVANLVKDDRTAAGEGFWGWSVEQGHIEPVFWPSYDDVVGLGVLDGGYWGRVFGLDEGGWATGRVDRFVEPTTVTPEGRAQHGFLYIHGTTEPGHLRVLPSLYSVENDVTNWREWNGSGVHAVNGVLDQAASASHRGFAEDGQPTYGATVWVNVSTCGVEVATTHDPWHLTDLGSAREASAEITDR